MSYIYATYILLYTSNITYFKNKMNPVESTFLQSIKINFKRKDKMSSELYISKD